MEPAGAKPQTVDYATEERTPAGEDYGSTSGMLTFAAGETAKEVSVNILDDEDGYDERVVLELSTVR